jgi:hypothetical protein
MTSHKDKREITLIVIRTMALIAAQAGISYGVVYQPCNCKKPDQSSRGHLRPDQPCKYLYHALPVWSWTTV